MHARLRGPKSLLTPDFPSLADEIAEPRPDMNIKVVAFTVREKSIDIPEYAAFHCLPKYVLTSFQYTKG